ncbi:MAG: hypothetical protein QOH96_1406 [Blastocatellia bacterium]|jgi:hypothetical protein|nr:hypothetical protein [Blastocatellia bacterium]
MPLWGEDTSAQRLKVSAHTANKVVLGRLGLWEGSAFLVSFQFVYRWLLAINRRDENASVDHFIP